MDHSKGQVLGEISRRVNEITQLVRTKEAELVPKMARRKELKTELQAERDKLKRLQESQRKALQIAIASGDGQTAELLLEEAHHKHESKWHLSACQEPGVDAELRLIDAKLSTSAVELSGMRERVADLWERVGRDKVTLEKTAAAAEQERALAGDQGEEVEGLARLLGVKMAARGLENGGGGAGGGGGEDGAVRDAGGERDDHDVTRDKRERVRGGGWPREGEGRGSFEYGSGWEKLFFYAYRISGQNTLNIYDTKTNTWSTSLPPPPPSPPPPSALFSRPTLPRLHASRRRRRQPTPGRAASSSLLSFSPFSFIYFYI